MNSEEQDKQRRKKLILQCVQQQLSSPETPEVRTHYERLRSLGHTDEKARDLIATILAMYFWHTLREDDYSYADYVAELANLPEIDWRDEETSDDE